MDTRIIGIALAGLFASSAAIAAGTGLQSSEGLDQGQPRGEAQVAPGHEMKTEKGAGYGARADTYEYGFQSLDTDQNGSISREEASADEGLSGKYDQADSNGDGKVGKSEFAQFERTDDASAQEPDTTKDTSAADKPYGSITNENPDDAEGPPKLEE